MELFSAGGVWRSDSMGLGLPLERWLPPTSLLLFVRSGNNHPALEVGEHWHLGCENCFWVVEVLA